MTESVECVEPSGHVSPNMLIQYARRQSPEFLMEFYLLIRSTDMADSVEAGIFEHQDRLFVAWFRCLPADRQQRVLRLISGDISGLPDRTSIELLDYERDLAVERQQIAVCQRDAADAAAERWRQSSSQAEEEVRRLEVAHTEALATAEAAEARALDARRDANHLENELVEARCRLVRRKKDERTEHIRRFRDDHPELTTRPTRIKQLLKLHPEWFPDYKEYNTLSEEERRSLYKMFEYAEGKQRE